MNITISMNLLTNIRSNLQSVWHVGIVKNSLDEIFDGVELEVQWIQPVEKDCWYSDPFILDITDSEYIILVEQYNVNQGKGVITRLIVDKDTARIKSKKVVLELSTHLSFPAIFRVGGDVYIHPENSEAYRHDLHKYNRQTNKFDFCSNICRGQVTDASFLYIAGESYMFCTKEPDSYGKNLYIYRRTKEGYQEQNKIAFNEYIARMGGNFFGIKRSE